MDKHYDDYIGFGDMCWLPGSVDGDESGRQLIKSPQVLLHPEGLGALEVVHLLPLG